MSSGRGIVLFGHGSRDPGWRQPMDAVARSIAARDPQARVTCAFLEMQQPDLGAAVDAMVASGARSIVVLPMFLGVGKHLREDLPRLVEAARERHPRVPLHVLPSAGESQALVDLLANLALEGS
ncbi:MAG: Sirohydrochlorin cobaltochelatase [uncultured Ramlibacter sp.]|uniref:Sirohydrochlorin cobaltochelatase n=1 Tax=uncultured Ramlibacter sp. TaxID=260755 RepID=A0A6J4PWE9_9BURK|nr:MAG: Sirohydrochlorin cobaltochelatase [uncultured Ramlibacter sp.]